LHTNRRAEPGGGGGGGKAGGSGACGVGGAGGARAGAGAARERPVESSRGGALRAPFTPRNPPFQHTTSPPPRPPPPSPPPPPTVGVLPHVQRVVDAAAVAADVALEARRAAAAHVAHLQLRGRGRGRGARRARAGRGWGELAVGSRARAALQPLCRPAAAAPPAARLPGAAASTQGCPYTRPPSTHLAVQAARRQEAVGIGDAVGLKRQGHRRSGLGVCGGEASADSAACQPAATASKLHPCRAAPRSSAAAAARRFPPPIPPGHPPPPRPPHRRQLCVVQHHLLPPGDVELWGGRRGRGAVSELRARAAARPRAAAAACRPRLQAAPAALCSIPTRLPPPPPAAAPYSLSAALTRSRSCQWWMLVGRSGEVGAQRGRVGERGRSAADGGAGGARRAVRACCRAPPSRAAARSGDAAAASQPAAGPAARRGGGAARERASARPRGANARARRRPAAAP
jgi:hypothetical protein